ncbi:MAG: hypothetical protein EA421_02475 [Gemmatimonadales bacterium]|nr:MAG: hypothetical protein EA421_02475 [Gemmatimonadales bacterium]
MAERRSVRPCLLWSGGGGPGGGGPGSGGPGCGGPGTDGSRGGVGSSVPSRPGSSPSDSPIPPG